MKMSINYQEVKNYLNIELAKIMKNNQIVTLKEIKAETIRIFQQLLSNIVETNKIIKIENIVIQVDNEEENRDQSESTKQDFNTKNTQHFDILIEKLLLDSDVVQQEKAYYKDNGVLKVCEIEDIDYEYCLYMTDNFEDYVQETTLDKIYFINM